MIGVTVLPLHTRLLSDFNFLQWRGALDAAYGFIHVRSFELVICHACPSASSSCGLGCVVVCARGVCVCEYVCAECGMVGEFLGWEGGGVGGWGGGWVGRAPFHQ